MTQSQDDSGARGPMSEDPMSEDPMAGVRPYLELASGILGMSAAKAAELAQGLWAQGGVVVGDTVTDAVDSAVEQGGQVAALLSPDQIRGLVREEVDRLVRRLGFAREDEVASLRREVGRLEQQVAALDDRLSSDSAAGTQRHGAKHDGKKSKGKKAQDKKAQDKKAQDKKESS